MKKDLTTKEAITAITEDIAYYLLGLEISDIEFVDKELKRIEKREADIVAKCKINAQEAILHLEIQNTNDALMDRRMLRYYNDIKTLFNTLPIFQYLIYIGKPALSMKGKIKEERLSFSYTIIDMHTIDCEKFLAMDTPDALVLSILCDFKGKDELEILTYILNRLSDLTKEDEHKLGKYMLMLETLSSNRDLQYTLKKAEEMLRETKLEDLPSYQIAMERGISQGVLQTAAMMIEEFHLSIEQVAKKLNLPVEKLKAHLNQDK